MKFILGVISEEIKVKKVKKVLIIEQLRNLQFKTISEINSILKERIIKEVGRDEEEEDK